MICAACREDGPEVERASFYDGGALCLNCYAKHAPDTHSLSAPRATGGNEDTSDPTSLSATYCSEGGYGEGRTALGADAADDAVALDPRFVAETLRALGICATEGEVFVCTLPGGGDHEAVVFRADGGRGHVRYRCACTSEQGVGLAEVRAAYGYGRLRVAGQLSGVELARWRERLLWEAGLLSPRPVLLPLPSRKARTAARVAAGLGLFLGLRDERWDGQPFVWAAEFAAAWCYGLDDEPRMSVDAAKRARVALDRCGALRRVNAPERGSRQPIQWVTPGMAKAAPVPASARGEVAA